MKHIIWPALLAILLSACAPATVAPTIAPTATPTYPPSQTPPPPTATFPPSGGVDVGGRVIHYSCSGEGTPTVIVEAGYADAGASDGNWDGVVDVIESTTRICLYDRANTGISDPAADVRTSQDVVNDLRALLTGAHIEPPYVLIGYSIGGWHVRLYADQYPQEVTGIMLIDTHHPDHFTQMAAVYPTASPNESVSLTQLRAPFTDPDSSEFNPERLNFAASAALVRETGPYGEIPLFILSHDPASLNPVLPPQTAAQLEQIWAAGQADMAGLSEISESIVVPETTNNLLFEKPQAVIDAILSLIGFARRE